jgi:LuxR family maltose regulon positive regulatory protein
LPSDALGHALAAADWQRAIDLLDLHWPEMLAGRGRFLETTFLPSPPEETAASPPLALAFAVQRRDAGDLDGMRMFLRTAERAAGAHPSDRLARILDGLRLAEAQGEGDPERILSIAGRLAVCDSGEVLSDHCEAIKALALSATASAKFAVVDLDGMEEALREYVPLARRTGHSIGNIAALGQMALGNIARGRLGASVHSAQLVLGAALNAGLTRAPDVSLARYVLASVGLERGLIEEAQYNIEQALGGDNGSDPFVSASAPLLLARFHQLRGDPTAALDALRADRIGVGNAPPPLLAAAATLIEAELCVADGQLSAAWRLLGDPVAAARTPHWHATVRTTLHLAEGEPERVAALWRNLPSPMPSATIEVEACLLRARAAWELADSTGAFRLVERALQLANAEAIRRPFLLHEEKLRVMLMSHLSAGTEYPAMLADLVRGAPGMRALPVANHRQLVEQLTERESMVLRYLSSTLSTAEVAGVLDLSINTVKTHVKNIYRKLDVGRRRDAVRRGRELGL